MSDNDYDLYDQAVDVDTTLASPPQLPPPRSIAHPPQLPLRTATVPSPAPDGDNFVTRVKRQAPPVPTDQRSTLPAPASLPPLPPRIIPPIQVNSDDKDRSFTCVVNSSHSRCSDINVDVAGDTPKKTAKKTLFGMNVLQRPFGERKERRKREEVSYPADNGVDETNEIKMNKIEDYRQSISEVTQLVGGKISRLIGRFSTTGHAKLSQDRSVSAHGTSDEEEAEITLNCVHPMSPSTWCPPLPPAREAAVGIDNYDSSFSDDFSDDENEYANENDTVYQNDDQIEQPAVTSQLGSIENNQIDYRFHEEIAPSTNHQTINTRLVFESMSSLDDKIVSVFPNTQSSCCVPIRDSFSATERTCNITTQSVSGDTLTQTDQPDNIPTTPTNKSNKLEAIKRELKMMFPTIDHLGKSRTVPRAKLVVKVPGPNVEEFSSAPSSPTLLQRCVNNNAQSHSPQMLATAPELSDAFKGVMPSPMSTRRTWQPFMTINGGHGPVSSNPLELQTPSPHILQSSPLLPNRPLPLIPGQRWSSQIMLESMAMAPALPYKATNSQLDDVTIGNDDSCTSVHSSHSDRSEDLNTQMMIDLHQYVWYFGTMNRELSESLLKAFCQEGGFLVRETRNGGVNCPYVISLYHSGSVFHLLIRKKPQNKFALGVEKPNEKAFKTVADLVAHHRRFPVFVTMPDSQNQREVLLVSSPHKLF